VAVNAPLVVVTGTGTGIGKTHLTSALLLALRGALLEAGVPHPGVAGLKPIETGVGPGATEEGDGAALERLSTFHVKHLPPPYHLARAVSPHLAAREEGLTIEAGPVVRYVERARAEADVVAVELAGGLFSPLAPRLSNADLTRALAPDVVLLVAPDRLGVLHDVAATVRAAAAAAVALTGIILVAPAAPDASTGTNGDELAVVTDLPVLARLPRADVATLACRADLLAIVRPLVRARRSSPSARPPRP
jgi:dethiobiotin synthetase